MAAMTLFEYQWNETDEKYRRGHYDGELWVSWVERGGSDSLPHAEARRWNHIFFFHPRPSSIRKNSQILWKISHTGTQQLKKARFRQRETMEWRLSGSFSETLRREFEHYLKQESKFRFNNTLMGTPYSGDVTLLLFQSGGYVDCVESDLDKKVETPAITLGKLLYYDNSSRKWWIAYNNDPKIDAPTNISVVGGTGTGNLFIQSALSPDYNNNVPASETEVVFVTIKSANFGGTEGAMMFKDVDSAGNPLTDRERKVNYEIVLERVTTTGSGQEVEGYE